jgi:hypothetical protein
MDWNVHMLAHYMLVISPTSSTACHLASYIDPWFVLQLRLAEFVVGLQYVWRIAPPILQC